MQPRVRRTIKGVLINGRLRQPDFKATREVHFIGDYVVKVDEEGQNRQEWRKWKRIRREDRRYFASVLACSHARKAKRGKRIACPSWLIQPRIRFRPGPPSEAAKVKVAELARRYRLSDLLTGDESMGHPNYVRNWGVARDGTPVIFDYAL